MKVAGLHFDEASHTYTLDGRVVPSVTQALKVLPSAYHLVDEAVLDRAAELGRAVHRMIELELAQALDESSLDDALKPYLGRFRHFMAASGFEPLLSEAQVASRRYGYAGTLDLFGVLNGRKAVIDAKRTAAVPRSAGPQTAAYAVALAESCQDLLPTAAEASRYALHLTPSRWQLVPFHDPADTRVFLSALTIAHWSKA